MAGGGIEAEWSRLSMFPAQNTLRAKNNEPGRTRGRGTFGRTFRAMPHPSQSSILRMHPWKTSCRGGNEDDLG